MKKTLAAAPLKTLLNRTHLNGTMDECILKVNKGIGHIIALDMSNSVMVDVSEKLPGLDDGEYGVGKLDSLVKFLEMCKDEDLTYTIDEKWLTLRRPGHGKFSILLLEIALVGTQVEADPEFDKNMTEYPFKIPILQEYIDDAQNYITIVGGQQVSFHITPKGKIILSNSTTNENERFETPFGSVEPTDGFTIAVYSQQLSRVFAAMTINEKSKLYLAKDRPVIIQQDAVNAWALTNSVV
jgi:hypothetical protein